ncbi:hypothetical protein D3C73_1380490 [compost metagenome]
MTVRPMTSARTTVQAPISAATGRTRECRAPTSVRAACGATRPTKAMTPTDETAPAVSSTAMESRISRDPDSLIPSTRGESSSTAIKSRSRRMPARTGSASTRASNGGRTEAKFRP